MFRKTLSALVAVAGLSFAGAAFAAEPAAAPEKPAATAPAGTNAKAASHKVMKSSKGTKVSKAKQETKTEVKSETKTETKAEGGQAQTVDMSKQPKAQPRTAHTKTVRINKKVVRTAPSTSAKPAPLPMQK